MGWPSEPGELALWVSRLRELGRAFWEFNEVPRTHFAEIPGEPKAKQRARHGKGRTYRVDREDEEAIGWHLARAWHAPPSEREFALIAVFHRSNRRRFDTDNAMKLVKDAGNGVVWWDDSQVQAELGILEVDRANPRTVLIFGERT